MEGGTTLPVNRFVPVHPFGSVGRGPDKSGSGRGRPGQVYLKDLKNKLSGLVGGRRWYGCPPRESVSTRVLVLPVTRVRSVLFLGNCNKGLLR